MTAYEFLDKLMPEVLKGYNYYYDSWERKDKELWDMFYPYAQMDLEFIIPDTSDSRYDNTVYLPQERGEAVFKLFHDLEMDEKYKDLWDLDIIREYKPLKTRPDIKTMRISPPLKAIDALDWLKHKNTLEGWLSYPQVAILIRPLLKTVEQTQVVRNYTW